MQCPSRISNPCRPVVPVTRLPIQNGFSRSNWDGFRALAYVHGGACRLISRNGNVFKSYPALPESLSAELRARSAILDGEIVALDRHGKSQFRDLIFRRGEPRFYAFDLLWLDGEDLRYLPLIDRKLRLRSVVPQRGERLLYCDHIEQDGEGLFRLALMPYTFAPRVISGRWMDKVATIPF